MARWTAVDRETGELFEFSSRNAMRDAVHRNPSLQGRERVSAEELRLGRGERPSSQPLWSTERWVPDRTYSIYRERAGNIATSALRYSFMKAATARDVEAAARIRVGWQTIANSYVSGNLSSKGYMAGMAELLAWLNTTPYAPPVQVLYHVADDDAGLDDDVSDEEYGDEYEGEE